MRLYGEEERATRVVAVEDYSLFNSLLGSKKLFIALIAYIVLSVVGVVMGILEGAYIMAGVDAVIHALICVSLFMFNKANKSIEEKFSDKGLKMFQITHAVKYGILFILMTVLLVMIVLRWSSTQADLNKAFTAASSEADKAAAKVVKNQNGWIYLGILIGYLIFSCLVYVYYKAVMAIGEGARKYYEKGTHFWEDLKFGGYYCFVTAGLLLVLGALGALGLLDKIVARMSNADVASFAGGLGWFAFIYRALFAGLLVYVGLLCLKGYKTMSAQVTSTDIIVDADTGEQLTEEEVAEVNAAREARLKALQEEEETEAESMSDEFAKMDEDGAE